MAHEFEIRQQAEELYILEGVTLDQAAKRLQVPEATIKRWSAEDGWVDMRRDYRRAQGEIRRQTMLYRLELLKKGIASLDPQAAYAWATVEQTAAKSRIGESENRGTGDTDTDHGHGSRPIVTPEDAINALSEAIQRRLNGLLSSPDAVNLKAVRELKDAMGMVEEMKRKYGTEKTDRILSTEEIRAIREQYL